MVGALALVVREVTEVTEVTEVKVEVLEVMEWPGIRKRSCKPSKGRCYNGHQKGQHSRYNCPCHPICSNSMWVQPKLQIDKAC